MLVRKELWGIVSAGDRQFILTLGKFPILSTMDRNMLLLIKVHAHKTQWLRLRHNLTAHHTQQQEYV